MASLAGRTDLPGVEFCYATLPTLWQTARGLDYSFFDIVVGIPPYPLHILHCVVLALPYACIRLLVHGILLS